MNGEVNTAGHKICAYDKNCSKKYEADWDQAFYNWQKLISQHYNGPENMTI